jgi:HSP20 family molecular chaperone IbpA
MADDPNTSAQAQHERNEQHQRNEQHRRNEKDKEAAGGMTAPQIVPVNVWQTDDSVVVVAPLPAVMPEDVTLTVSPGTLVIDAAMRTPARRPYLVQEWTYGPYRREVEVPRGFGSEVQASLANGQLAVRLRAGDPPAQGHTVPV